MAGTCYQWTMPSAELADYLVGYTPVGGAYTQDNLEWLPFVDNQDGTYTLYICSETVPEFFDSGDPNTVISFPYTVTAGGSCTSNTECDPTPPPTYTLSVIDNPDNSSTQPGDGTGGDYEEGEEIQLDAVPVEGYVFVNWTVLGVEVSNQASFTYVMPGEDTTLVANFEEEAPAPDPDLEPAELGVPDNFLPLELRVAGVSIPLNKLTRKRITGIFTSDLVGDYSYPITIPIDYAIMTALGFPDDPQTSWDFSKPFDAELWKSGNRLYKGKMEILEATEDTIEAVFALGSGFFVSNFSETKLSECFEDNDIITLDEPEVVFQLYRMFAAGFATADMVKITINGNSKEFERADYDISGEVQTGQEEEYYNHVLEQLQLFYQDAVDWMESLGIPMNTAIVFSEDETGRGSYIQIEETTTALTVDITGYTTTSRGEWISYNNRNLKVVADDNIRLDMAAYDAFDPSKRLAFPQIYNKELYEGNNAVFDGQVNRYDENGYLKITNSVFTTWEEAVNWENTVIPFLYLTEVVTKVFAKGGITASGEFFQEDIIKHMLLYNNRTLDFIRVGDVVTGEAAERSRDTLNNPDPDSPDYDYRNVLDLAIKIKNHLPDVTTTGFLKALKNFFGLKYDFNPLQNRVEIRFIRNIIRGRNPLDMTDQAHRVYTIKHSQENGFAYTFDNPDPLFSDGMENTPPESPDYVVVKYTDMLLLDPVLEETAHVQSLGAYFRFEKAKEEAPRWDLYAFEMQDEEQTEQKVSKPLTMFPLMDAYVDGKKMPAIEMTANNPEAGIENKDIGIRIFGFYGQQNSVAGYPYPFASSNQYDAAEIKNNAQFDLNIRKQDMAYWWQDLETIQGKPRIYETVLLLSDADVVNLSRTSLIRIRNIVYLIDEIQEAITREEQTLAKVKMYKVKTK